MNPYHLPPPSLNYDVVTYSKAKRAFNMWYDNQHFPQVSQSIFNHDFTNDLSESVGGLVQRQQNGLFYTLGTAFVVSHFQAHSHIRLPDGSRVKALLLTAAHIFTSPFKSRIDPTDIFFTLSPILGDKPLDTYSKFRVKRLVNFEPFKSDPQIDPILGYEFILPQDIDILAILETDTAHDIQAEGNNLRPLAFQKWDDRLTARDCVVVGYAGSPNDNMTFLWAPIIQKHQELEKETEKFYLSELPIRVFSVGQVLRSNETCIAVSCSTWAGMSGSPICILAPNGKNLAFCGVYNGARAVPFQALVAKIIFRLQGKAPNLRSPDDIPRIPTGSIDDYVIWVYALLDILDELTYRHDGRHSKFDLYYQEE